jgi:hypothetical protein
MMSSMPVRTQEPPMVDAHTIPISDMAQHLAAGDAEPLLPEGVPGPVRLADQWWAVPTGHDQYWPVTDPAAVIAFDQGSARLTAHRAQILARTGERRQ